MVNKSVTNREDEFDYNLDLKTRNKNLALELSKQKLISKQYLDEKNNLERKHYSSLLLNLKYESHCTKLKNQCKEALTLCVALTSSIGKMLDISSQCVNLPKTSIDEDRIILTDRPSQCVQNRSSSPINKTHAVQPMVGGHVIGKPMINLERIVETSTVYSTNSDTESSLSESDSEDDVQTQNNCSTGSQRNCRLEVATSGFLHQPISDLVSENDETDESDDDEILCPIVVLEKRNPERSCDTIVELDESITSSNISKKLLGGESGDLHITQEERKIVGQNKVCTFTNLVQENIASRLRKLNAATVSVENAELDIAQEKIRMAVRSKMPALPKMENLISRSRKLNAATSSASCESYNPLEGPSTLLDNDGYFRRRRVVNSRKVIEYNEDDSSADESAQIKESNNSRERRSRSETKRKIEHFDENIEDSSTDESYQPKRANCSAKRHKANIGRQPVVLLTKLSASDCETSADKPRRNALRGTLKEASLKTKLRRTK